MGPCAVLEQIDVDVKSYMAENLGGFGPAKRPIHQLLNVRVFVDLPLMQQLHLGRYFSRQVSSVCSMGGLPHRRVGHRAALEQVDVDVEEATEETEEDSLE